MKHMDTTAIKVQCFVGLRHILIYGQGDDNIQYGIQHFGFAQDIGTDCPEAFTGLRLINLVSGIILTTQYLQRRRTWCQVHVVAMKIFMVQWWVSVSASVVAAIWCRPPSHTPIEWTWYRSAQQRRDTEKHILSQRHLSAWISAGPTLVV